MKNTIQLLYIIHVPGSNIYDSQPPKTEFMSLHLKQTSLGKDYTGKHNNSFSQVFPGNATIFQFLANCHLQWPNMLDQDVLR